jgi:hypothetical protein
MLQIVASPMIVIYSCNVFIVQATGRGIHKFSYNNLTVIPKLGKLIMFVMRHTDPYNDYIGEA